MLNRAGKDSAAALIKLLDDAPVNSVRLSALLRAYGTGRSFFNVWIQDDYGAVLSRLENTFSLLDLGRPNFEETAFFLEFNPFFKRLSGNFETVGLISKYLSSDSSLERINLMGFKGGRTAAPGPFMVSRQPELKTVFDIITGAMPQESEYPAWYADLSHRMRHGCARAYLLSEGGEPASACLVSAESERAGLISGVATRADCRGRGLASRVIGCACADLAAGGKISVLECLDELMPFYKKIGFEKIGDVGELLVK